MKTKIKWRVNGLPIIIDEKNNIWREPFITNNHNYDYKKIEFHIHQGNEYLRLSNKRYSKLKIKTKLYRVNEIHDLPITVDDCPF